jgi:hypothetical protein
MVAGHISGSFLRIGVISIASTTSAEIQRSRNRSRSRSSKLVLQTELEVCIRDPEAAPKSILYIIPAPTVQDAAARFRLMIKEGRRLIQQAVTDVSVGVMQLMTAKLDELQGKVMIALDSENLAMAKERVALCTI